MQGIASTLIIVRIGLGVDVLSASQPPQITEGAENQAADLEDHMAAAETETQAECTTGHGGLVEPFWLKYDPANQPKGPNMTAKYI